LRTHLVMHVDHMLLRSSEMGKTQG